MGPISHSGNLEATPLPRLLLDLHRARFGGELRLSRDRVEKRFLFHAGRPVFAESNLARESLGNQLMNAGRFGRDEYARVIELAEHSGCSEGNALLELGLIDPKGLFEALKEQVRSRLLDCFGWARGEFALDAEAKPPEDAQAFRVDLFSLLQEGIEKHWSAEQVIADLGDRMALHPTPGELFAHVEPRLARDPDTDAMLAQIDGENTLWQALQQRSSPRALAAAWLLDAVGALDYEDDAKASEDDETASSDLEIEFVQPAERRARTSARPRASRPPVQKPDAPDARRVASLRSEIEARFEKLDEIDFYGVLGLRVDASFEEIKRTYLKAAKTYHPDALARSGVDRETRDRASRVFAKISKAYAVISDPERRALYDESLGSDDSALDANRLATAENLFRKAEVLLRQGNFRGALEFLKPCVELWPDEAEYRSALGWVLYKKMPSEPEAALENLQAASRLDPASGVVQFRLGLVLRALGEVDAADQALERARARGHEVP